MNDIYHINHDSLTKDQFVPPDMQYKLIDVLTD